MQLYLYLEKEFVDEFIHLDLKNKLVDDFYEELIKDSRGYSLYTNFSEQEFSNKKLDNPLAFSISEDTVAISYDYSKEDFLDNNETMHKLILEKNNNENNQRGNKFECISSNNLIEKWKMYSPRENFIEVPCIQDNLTPRNERFSEWKDLQIFCQQPINEVIICDKYLLTDKYHQSIQNNLIPMLKEFQKMTADILKIKIICHPDQILIDERYNNNRYISNNLDLTGKVRNIKDRIRTQIKNCEIEMLVLTKDNMYLQHDRWIYTGLYILTRGAGWGNIFDGNNRIKDSSEMYFKFIFLRRFSTIFKLRISILKRIIDTSRRIDTEAI